MWTKLCSESPKHITAEEFYRGAFQLFWDGGGTIPLWIIHRDICGTVQHQRVASGVWIQNESFAKFGKRLSRCALVGEWEDRTG